MHKTRFVLDSKPLPEASSPHAGALATSRAFRAIGYPQLIESIALLQTIGGDCPENSNLFRTDACLHRGLGCEPPKPTAIREFLERFHDPQLEAQRPSRDQQLSFIIPASDPVKALQQGQEQRIATIDQDATIIESHNRNALAHYQGGRGYQPMLVVADEFRDGNVPARQDPLSCCRIPLNSATSATRSRPLETSGSRPSRRAGHHCDRDSRRAGLRGVLGPAKHPGVLLPRGRFAASEFTPE